MKSSTKKLVLTLLVMAAVFGLAVTCSASAVWGG